MRKGKKVIRITLIAAAVITTLIVLVAKNDNAYVPRESEVLKVVIERDTPGFFEYNSIYYGYMFDMLQNYARHIDNDLYIKVVATKEEAARALRSSAAEIALTHKLSKKEMKKYGLEGFDISSPGNYALLSREVIMPDSLTGLYGLLKGKRVLISDGFPETALYKSWQDSSGAELIDNAGRFSRALAKDLIDKKVDFLICSEENATLFSKQYPQLYKTPAIDSSATACFYVSKKQQWLAESFNTWYFDHYFLSRAFIYNEALYKSDLFANKIITEGFIIPFGQLTPVDHIFKKIGHKYNIDWRLLAAIGHKESRFNPEAVSGKGAIGIMQVMPHVAKEFRIRKSDLKEIETNIETAAALINDIKKSLAYKQDTLSEDQLSIVLACYNAGYGHVKDAISLARKHGKSAADWKGIASFLQKKSEEEFYTDEVVKYGKFGAGETIDFVRKVQNRYSDYKNNAKNNEE